MERGREKREKRGTRVKTGGKAHNFFNHFNILFDSINGAKEEVT